MGGTVLVEKRDGVALVTLNRPTKLNAFNYEMGTELVAVLDSLGKDDDVRVAVITGAGDAFCAGADLSSGNSSSSFAGSSKSPSAFRDAGGILTLALYRFQKPIVAAINGSAIGIGITMTLPMDIRVASEDAKVGFVFARRGIVPEAASSYFLPRIVGMGKSLEWCVTGRVFRAKDEEASGLFNYVVPRDQVLPRAMALAGEIAKYTSATSVALSKALLWGSMREGGASPEAAHLADSKCIQWSSSQEDAFEGVVSFKEKRSPNFPMRVPQDLPDFYPLWHMIETRSRL